VHYQDNGLATFTDGGGWLTQEWLTRPIDSWTATITEVRTGKVAVSTGGGPLISKVGISWDGMLAGKRAPNGQYRYSISGTIGGVTTTLGSGTMGVWCGTPNFRDFNCSGQPSVLGLTSSPAGQAHWLTANPASVTDGGAAETWTIGSGASQVTAMVPFGDTNQDYSTTFWYGVVTARCGSTRAPVTRRSRAPSRWSSRAPSASTTSSSRPAT
jgi:hypothetical protein